MILFVFESDSLALHMQVDIDNILELHDEDNYTEVGWISQNILKKFPPHFEKIDLFQFEFLEFHGREKTSSRIQWQIHPNFLWIVLEENLAIF